MTSSTTKVTLEQRRNGANRHQRRAEGSCHLLTKGQVSVRFKEDCDHFNFSLSLEATSQPLQFHTEGSSYTDKLESYRLLNTFYFHSNFHKKGEKNKLGENIT